MTKANQIEEDFERALQQNKVKWRKLQDKGVNYSQSIPDITLKQYFNNLVDRSVDKTYIYYRDKEYSYGECNLIARRIANGLKRLGCQKGDRVITYMANCPEFVCLAHACFKLGAILVNSNPLDTPNEMEHRIRDCGAKVIVAGDLAINSIIEALMEIEQGPKYIVVNAQQINIKELSEIQQQMIEWGWLMENGDEEPPADIDPDDIAVLQYTGGTTGVLKGSCQTNRGYIARVLGTYEYYKPILPAGEEYRVIIGVPMSHAYGFNQGIICNMAYGGSMILMDSIEFNIRKLLEKIETYRPNIWPAVPICLKILCSDPELLQYDLSSIRVIGCGGAPLPVATILQTEKITGAIITEGYGLTEAIMTVTSNTFCARKPGKVGIPAPNVDLLVVDAETGERVMPYGESGEIIIRGPSVTKCYWNKPTETSASIKNGWFYTGDIGMIDESGYLQILDRKKDVIIVSGFNVYPKEIDDVLMSHPDVIDACTIGIFDEFKGEVPKSFVVRNKQSDISERQLTMYCREKLTRYKIPKQIQFVDLIPKTKNNKPNSNILRNTNNL